MKLGTLVISLDFELMWGMFDKVTTDSYGKNIVGARETIPRVLDIFAERDIHATWATVGMLAFDSFSELREFVGETKGPSYERAEFSSYRRLQTLAPENEQYYFAPSLIRKIADTSGQEVASHTFSHYYCLESGQTLDEFREDCRLQKEAFKRLGIELSSIVFPRNQTNDDYLSVCKEFGLTSYRGTEDHLLYRARIDEAQSLPVRGLRLLDHYLNLSGQHTFVPTQNESLMNIPSSRFLRPYSSTLSFAEPLRLRRIKQAMTKAAKSGEVFHVWWHPHNFGSSQEENLAVLRNLLDHVDVLKKTYGMESKTMRELATTV